MRRALSAQKNLKHPRAERTPYAPTKIFKLSRIARDGLNKMTDKPLPTARKVIKRGLLAVKIGNTRVSKIWKIDSGLDD